MSNDLESRDIELRYFVMKLDDKISITKLIMLLQKRRKQFLGREGTRQELLGSYTISGEDLANMIIRAREKAIRAREKT